MREFINYTSLNSLFDLSPNARHSQVFIQRIRLRFTMLNKLRISVAGWCLEFVKIVFTDEMSNSS